MRSEHSCMGWNTKTSRDTAFVRHFVTEQVNVQIILVKFARWHSLTTSATKQKGLTLALTFSTNDAH